MKLTTFSYPTEQSATSLPESWRSIEHLPRTIALEETTLPRGRESLVIIKQGLRFVGLSDARASDHATVTDPGEGETA
ncbi:hypothetical protein StoSoilB22_19060 [Arthrobacter sp. StoSoilB22]|nr:hypothetical protein StoSoilB22_19060 [Arthrobacter sp. StoSoilB22]